MNGRTPAERTPQELSPKRAPQTRAQLKQARSMTSLEREVDRLSRRVAELEREKAEMESFAALAAHELVEPLIMAEAFAAMVSERLPPIEHADSRADLAALSRGAARVRLLVEALLHDARASSGNIPSRYVDLDAVIRDCLTLLGPEVRSRGAHLTVSELPTVWGEEASLTGVFTNLLVNALKYSPRHGANIAVDAVQEGAVWRISVTSEGPAIPPEDRERIFEPFNRARGERRIRGAGLGLAICRRIVERHGGQLGVKPANGSGNVFYFTLPA
jgi:signal transduction histidine kinase